MIRQSRANLNISLKPKAPYLLTVSAAFFIYQVYILLNSFQADYQIYQNVSATVAQKGFVLRPIFWLFSELTVEVGLFTCVAGACFFLAFSLMLSLKGHLMPVYLKQAVVLHGTQYLFVVPFIILLFTGTSVASYEAATSYALQTTLITPSFIMLYRTLKQPTSKQTKIFKWTALSIIGFIFALWLKHFFFNLYALDIDFQDTALTVGFLNSTLTILLAAMFMLVATFPIIREKSTNINSKLFGLGLILVGVYFIVYCSICLFNQQYLSFLKLTDLWAITMPLLGIAFLRT